MMRQPNSGGRLLFVDDEESIRLTLPPLLQEKGFAVRVAASVPEALVEINSHQFDVLITDLNIGQQGDGFLIISAMRHLQPDCVNLILTGYPALETAVQAIRTQVDDYLMKPSDLDCLVTTIHEKLESRRHGLPPKTQTGFSTKHTDIEAGRQASEATECPAEKPTAGHERIRELTGRMLQLRDAERRKLARELHDSLGQLLTAVGIDLSLVQQEAPSLTPKAAKAAAEAADLVQQITQEVRTISHLLHPPLLDEVGIGSAIRCYLDGYAERSNIAVDLEIPPDFGRLSIELETTVFRIVQEALTNIHRHSGSSKARVRIARTSQEIRVEVRDYGKGIPSEKLHHFKSDEKSGVGIRGMRERVQQFGGVLNISSNGHGTLLIARVPMANSVAFAAKEGLAS